MPEKASPIRGSAPAFQRLYMSLQLLYEQSIERAPGRISYRLHGYGWHGLPSFVLTVAIWESYLNHCFFSPWAKTLISEEAYEKGQAVVEEMEKLTVQGKAFTVPLLILGKTFDKGKQPFQDFHLLVRIRNHITHNPSQTTPDKMVATLRERGLLMPLQHTDIAVWTEELCSLEVIRWCMNTLSAMSKTLISLGMKDSIRNKGFPCISEEDALRMYKANNIRVLDMEPPVYPT